MSDEGNLDAKRQVTYDREQEKTDNQEQVKLQDVLNTIVKRLGDTSRILECYYWSEEPELVNFVRQFLSMSDQVRGALLTFMSAIEDASLIIADMDGSGTLQLHSPEAAKVVPYLVEAKSNTRQLSASR
jgi:hypothetical protein